jgi:hypothetical protein
MINTKTETTLHTSLKVERVGNLKFSAHYLPLEKFKYGDG